MSNDKDYIDLYRRGPSEPSLQPVKPEPEPPVQPVRPDGKRRAEINEVFHIGGHYHGVQRDGYYEVIRRWKYREGRFDNFVLHTTVKGWYELDKPRAESEKALMDLHDAMDAKDLEEEQVVKEISRRIRMGNVPNNPTNTKEQ